MIADGCTKYIPAAVFMRHFYYILNKGCDYPAGKSAAGKSVMRVHWAGDESCKTQRAAGFGRGKCLSCDAKNESKLDLH